MRKDDYVYFRVAHDQKTEWKEYCKERKITLTDMLTGAAYYYMNEVHPMELKETSLEENGRG